MRPLHPDVASTAKEMIVKENASFRLRMEKWECLTPKNLFAVNLVQEHLNDKGEIVDSSAYNFHMTKEELQALAYGLTV